MIYKVFGDIIPPNTDMTKENIVVNCCFHADKNPSLSINTKKGVYNCFSCGAKGDLINAYMVRNNLKFGEAIKALGVEKGKEYNPIKTFEERAWINCNDDILNAFNNVYNGDINKSRYKELYDLIGLKMQSAIACVVGKNSKGWIFPIFRYPDNFPAGFEIRHAEFKKFNKGNKCYRFGGNMDCFAKLYDGDKDVLYITEGFKDGYFLHQYLYGKQGDGMPIKATIMTPACGVHQIPMLLKKHKLQEFKRIVFILDNDKAGNDVKEKIKNMDDRFEFFVLPKDMDFEDYYKKELIKK